MAVSSYSLIEKIKSKIFDSNISSIELAQLSSMLEKLNQSDITVASLSDLPSPQDNQGRFFYVEDIDDFRYSDGENWVREYRSTIIIHDLLFSWGDNSLGTLGDATNTNRSSPVSVSGGFTDWCAFSQSGATVFGGTLGIRSNGTLWGWGNSGNGQLGFFSSSPGQATPLQVTTASNWCAACTIGSSSLFLNCNGILWSSGSHSTGDTGLNLNSGQTNSPLSIVGGITDWCKITKSSSHSLALRSDNSLWSWGNNIYGRLGDGSTTNRSSPVSVNAVFGDNDWNDIKISNTHALAIKNDGTLWAWGSNSKGQFGNNSTDTEDTISPINVTQYNDWCTVSAGCILSAAIRTDGTLWTWGCNSSGQLGDGTTIERSSPVSVVGGFTDWCGVSVSTFNIAAVRSNGTLWTWGTNGTGQLGNDSIIGNSNSPVSVLGDFTDWCIVSINQFTNVALRSNGTVWSWGNNAQGQLGDSTTICRSSPVSVIGGFTDWCAISAGQLHVTAIRSNGTLWAWGGNSSGRLGDNSTTSRSSPVIVVGGFTDWCAVSAGNSYTAAIRTNGTLWTWGRNNYGQLGDGTKTDRFSPVSVVGGFTDWCKVSASILVAALRSNGSIWTWGSPCLLGQNLLLSATSPIKADDYFSDWTNIIGSFGKPSIVGLRSNGTIWSWGYSPEGIATNYGKIVNFPLSLPGNIKDWVSFDNSGNYGVAAIRSDGTLWAWGNNSWGQLGDNTSINRSSPVSVVGGFTDWIQIGKGKNFSAGIRSNGSIWTWGSNNRGQLGDENIELFCRSSPVMVGGGFSDWCFINASSYTVHAIRTDGTLWAWGQNFQGKLGDGTQISRSSPVSVVGGFTDWCTVNSSNSVIAAIRTDGSLWAWGSNNIGQLGDGTVICRSSPVSVVGGFTDWCNISVSSNHTAAIRTNGTLWTWGSNDSGKLGDGTVSNRSSPASILGEYCDWYKVTIARNSTIAIRSPGEMWVWGDNGCGELMSSCIDVLRSSPVSIAGNTVDWSVISAGCAHTAAIRANGELLTWGINKFGLLGRNTDSFQNKTSPTKIYKISSDWCIIAAGHCSTAAIRTNGTLWTWGHNKYGMLGQDSATTLANINLVVGGFSDWCAVSVGTVHTAAIRSDGTLWTWGRNISGILGVNDGNICRSSPVSVVGGFTDWCKVSSNSSFIAAIRTNGTIWTWGRGSEGQLGNDGAAEASSPVSVVGGFTDWCTISAGNYHAAAIRTNSTLWTWGANNQGRLGDGTTANRSSPVSVVGGFTDWCAVCLGSIQSIAIRTNGTIWSWGSNFSGRLGIEATTGDCSSPVSVVGGFTDWCSISARGNHSVAMRTNGTIWTWGSNNAGQLGDGTCINRSSPVSILSTNLDWNMISAAGCQTFAIDVNNNIYSWGANYHGQLGIEDLNNLSPVNNIQVYNDWCTVSSGDCHIAAIRTNGTLWTWGSNDRGQIGDGTNICRSSPVSVVGGFTDWCTVSATIGSFNAAIRTDGTLWAWGNNASSSLGDGTSSNNRSSPVSVLGGYCDWCAVSGRTALRRKQYKGFN